MHRKDIAGCMRGFAPTFQGEDIQGDHYNRTQAKQNLIKSFSHARSITAMTTLKSIAFVNGSAIVMSQEHTELIITGKRTHHLHTLVFEGLWQSIWINTKAGWQAKGEKQLTSRITQDGVLKSVKDNR